MSVFNILEQRNYQSTIQTEYIDSVNYSRTQINAIVDEGDSFHEINVSPDVSVILVANGQIKELNTKASSRLSTAIQSDFLHAEDHTMKLDELIGETKFISQKTEDNELYSFFGTAIQTDSGTILVAKDAKTYEVFRHNKELLDFGLLVSLFTVVFIILFSLNKHIFKQILEMTEVAYDYSENKFNKNIEVVSNDVISNLAVAINKIGKTLETGSMLNTQEKKLLEHVYDSLEVGVIHVEEDFTIHSLNTLGQRFLTAFISNEAYYSGIEPFYETYIMEACHSKETQQAEIQQNQLIYDIRFIPVEVNETFETHSVLLLIKDITMDKQLVSIREDLITNVSHDLRTPLATIQGYSEAIKDDIAETLEEKNEMARIIHDEATQMSQMINSLLELSRLKAGYSELNKESVYLPDFLQRVINRFKDSLAREEIECDLVVEDGITYYQIDEDKMHNAIYNLIDNAIRYAAEKGTRRKRYIHIEVRLDELVDDLLIIISDNGIGISQQSMPFIFERFYKDDKARTAPKNNGSGIGLSLVQNIVKKHAGRIDVESKEGQGTTFMIRLPLLEKV